MRNMRKWPVLMLLCHASTASTSPSYTSVRALDQFGHSVQLKHAREAAHGHGRLVLAAQSKTNETVVVSIGSRPMVHQITLMAATDTENNDSCLVALCCTGVKGDASWLIQEMQSHAKRVWERYDHHLDAAATAHVVSRLLGSFGGEDADQEWQSSVQREMTEWARPLGVQTMILSPQTPILLVEPSGRVLSSSSFVKGPSVGIMGKDSDVLREKLRVKPLEYLETPDLQAFLMNLLVHVAPENEAVEVMVEILSSQGIRRTSIRMKDGKEASISQRI
jgi:20S proteasome alpha/beta subunit